MAMLMHGPNILAFASWDVDMHSWLWNRGVEGSAASYYGCHFVAKSPSVSVGQNQGGSVAALLLEALEGNPLSCFSSSQGSSAYSSLSPSKSAPPPLLPRSCFPLALRRGYLANLGQSPQEPPFTHTCKAPSAR